MTTQDKVVATTPMAMALVARHMLTHGLPAPFSIDRPCFGETRVGVPVYEAHLDAWLDSMVVDEEIVHPHAATIPGHERVSFVGRIDTEVGQIAIEVRSVRRVRNLTAVVAGGAA